MSGRHLAIVFCATFALSDAAEVAKSFEVRLDPRSALSASNGLEVVAVAVGRESGVVRVPVSSHARQPISLPITGIWRIGCEGRGFWCPTYVIQAGGTRNDVTLPLFASCRLSGKLLPPRGHTIPRLATIQGWVHGTSGGPPVEFTNKLAIDVHGRFDTLVPRATSDLRLAPDTYAPIYRWDVKANSNHLDLGALELRHGGSVSGTAIDLRTEEPVEAAEIRIAPAGMASVASPQEGGSRSSAETSRSSSTGFFQVTGLLPGRYRLDVRKADVATTLDGVEIHEQAETQLGAVRLLGVVELEIAVSPPRDARGRPWVVGLEGETPGERASVTATDADGVARFSKLRAGRYAVLVSDQAGSQLARREENVLSDSRLVIDVPLLRLAGSVDLKNRPLAAARILVQTGSSDRQEFQSDERGEFRGWIRRPDRNFLMVSVRSEDPPLERFLDITRLDIQGDVLRLDIHLSDVTLFGRVVDDSGAPVPGARVWARAAHGSSQRASADGEGQFRIAGLEQTRYTVFAEGRRGTSEPIEIDASTPVGPPEAILVLRDSREIEGLVISAEGAPVGGARITLEVPARAPVSTSTTSDGGGRFGARVSLDADHALVRVQAPFQVLWSGCLRLPEEGPLTIVLPPKPGGTLKIHAIYDPKAPPPRAGRLLVLTQDGGVFGPGDRASWRTALGRDALPAGAGGNETESLPNTAPGRYAIVWSALPWWDVARQACTGGAPQVLDATTLAPGGKATLSYDARRYQR